MGNDTPTPRIRRMNEADWPPVRASYAAGIATTQASEREAYRGVVEHSMYVHPDATGRGLGTALLQALIASTEAAGVWTIQSGVFPENPASLALHARGGFRVVGRRIRIGPLRGVWRDVILLERRSRVVG